MLIICNALGFAQKSFEADHQRFLRQFNQHLEYTGEFRYAGKSMQKEFTAFWQSDTLSEKQKDAFIATASLMLEKACKSYPEFVIYTVNRLEFVRKEIPEAQYQLYENELKEFLSIKFIKHKDFSDFMIKMYNFLAKKALLESPKIVWKVNSDEFEIAKKGKDFIINFSNTDLISYSNRDSVKIYATSGVYYPHKSSWTGKKGKATWERVGISDKDVYASLSNYEINLKASRYVADSVTFINSMYFNEPLLGQLTDDSQSRDDLTKSSFPRFRSYQQHFKIKNIVKGVDYEGGFSMRGKEFIGSGVDEDPAKIYIPKNDSIDFVAYSNSFRLDQTSIFSEHTEIILRLSEDSIYHPNLSFKYNINEGLLELIRLKEGMSQVNYTNSYHNISMDFTWLKWYIEKFNIEMTQTQIPGYQNEIAFESLDYYKYERYRQIKMQDARNPLDILIDYANFCNCSEFSTMELASFIGFSPTQVKQMLFRVAYMGFIFYDQEKELIRVKPEAWKFIDAAKYFIDSDVIRIVSTTPSQQTNAELSLLNYDIKVKGVPIVQVSDSQKINVYPIDKQIILRKNRSFDFNGTIQAGQFYYYGSNFKFDYNRFIFDMPQCDSMKMVAETDAIDASGNRKLAIVQNKLENFHGEFHIDDPENKSGRFDYDEYPKFITQSNAYVYYDDPKIHKGVYKRNNFYFEIPPFEMDSVGGFSPDNLQFAGRLVTGEIFPDIEETLVLRNDFSLGFNTNTGPVGLPLYNGRATYYKIIDLSNEGLRGKGKINYLTSEINSDYLLFFPESLDGHATDFKVDSRKQQVAFPSVKSTDNDIKWDVKRDNLFVYQLDDEFEMYDGNASHKGYLNIRSSGLEGSGVLSVEKAKLKSKLFEFSYEDFHADTLNFEIYAISELASDFDGSNVMADVSFKDRKGTFKSNGEHTTWEFKHNKYISIMDQMTWYMDKEELEISATNDVLSELEKNKGNLSPNEWEDMFLEGPKFMSVHPAQDSLWFVSPRARYNYKKHIINAEGVEYMKVADALFTLENGKVTIEKDAKMLPIEDVKIYANTTTRYHTIYDATVNVYGRLKYSGEGYYDYVDVIGRRQKVFLNSVGVDYSGQTIASGKISEPDNFMLSPHFGFQGDAKILANRENLEFVGAAKIVSECDTIKSQWVKFASVLDPSDIYIPIDSLPLDINNQKIANGLIMQSTGRAYPAFLSRTYTAYDMNVFHAHGYLYYDRHENVYMIGSKEKIEQNTLPGNLLMVHKNECKTEGQGRFSLSKPGEIFNLNAVGEFEYDYSSDTVDLFLSMLIHAPFSNSAWKKFADILVSNPGLEGINPRGEMYEQALVEVLGTKKADEWFANMSLGNMNRYPSELETMLILSDIEMQLHYGMGAFIHAGPVSIVNAGKNPINRSVFAYIRAERGKRSDVFEMLFEIDEKTWFYFRYVGGLFGVLSSENEFNEIIYNTKESNRFFEDKKTRRTYSYAVTSQTYYKRFKRDMDRKFSKELNQYDDNY